MLKWVRRLFGIKQRHRGPQRFKPHPDADGQVRVTILPTGMMDVNNAAKYLGRAPATLAQWRMQRTGPKWSKVGGRVYYHKGELDAFVRGCEQ